jgi:hypothetical protein
MTEKRRFTNNKTRKSSNKKIDIVITHVDSSSKKWREAFDLAVKEHYDPKVNNEDSIIQNRFNDNGELKYVLRSIDENLDFVRNVYLVIDDYMDVPDWITNVKIVRHSEILPKEYLPTFNSHVIESVLHKIEGISEPFMYFNNDVFVGKPVKLSQLYRNNKVSIFIDKNLPVTTDTKNNIVEHGSRSACKNSSRLLDIFLGKKSKIYLLRHTPHFFYKKVMNKIWKEFPNEMNATIMSRFRSINDVSMGLLCSYISLYTGLAFINKQKYNSLYLPPNGLYTNKNKNSSVTENLKNVDKYIFICVNNQPSYDVSIFMKIIKDMFTQKCMYEK